MGCWGATKEYFSNCCGGPHSEHYDAWLARERLRQLNAQTQRVDQLTRENTILGAALTQSQDILASYTDMDQFQTTEVIDRQPSLSAQLAARVRPPKAAVPAQVSMRRHESMTLDLPPSPQPVRRDDLRRAPIGSFRQRSLGTASDHSDQIELRPLPAPVGDPITPRMTSPFGRAPAPAGPERAVTPPFAPPARAHQEGRPAMSVTSAVERKAIMNRLMKPLPEITAAATRHAPPVDQPQASHPSTHGYQPQPKA